ncbi:hypothetical protein [Phenylobacterium sp.]|jgi:hypothetical protein|uniref:hypothetical protein n=1 Tax=Phenylobacterium sp. TaxID=1871053 RepID=UPI002E342B78|nr:hypothetical protein [Phenylobacterium sp.]HEX2558866.1 hypothetical protein [Phenylobacterium sp.]
MAYLGFFIGATIATAVIFFIIRRARKKRGDARLRPVAIWTGWVGLALYGLGAREDYDVDRALAYPLAAALIWGVLSWRGRAAPEEPSAQL